MSAHILCIGEAKPYDKYLNVTEDMKYPGGGRAQFAGNDLVKGERTEKKK